MLKPIVTSKCTTVLGAPKDWDAETNGECCGLPVYHEDGEFFSTWGLSDSERDVIASGGQYTTRSVRRIPSTC